MTMKILIKTLIILILCCSCNFNKSVVSDSDSLTWKIKNFEEKKSRTLKPDINKTYAAIVIKVLGETNDTIKIKRDDGYYEIKLSGEIDTVISSDYYGSVDRYFEFDPYLSKDGYLEINIDMY